MVGDQVSGQDLSRKKQELESGAAAARARFRQACNQWKIGGEHVETELAATANRVPGLLAHMEESFVANAELGCVLVLVGTPVCPHGVCRTAKRLPFILHS
jgi:hypothetical protein